MQMQTILECVYTCGFLSNNYHKYVYSFNSELNALFDTYGFGYGYAYAYGHVYGHAYGYGYGFSSPRSIKK